MGGGNPNSRPYLRFAGVSLLLTVAVACALAFAAARGIGSNEERQAASAAANTAGAAAAGIIGDRGAFDTLTEEQRFQLDVLTGLLIGESIQGIRVATANGVAYEAGDVPDILPPVPAGDRIDQARAQSNAAQSLFVTYDHHGEFVVEISQTPDAVESAIAAVQRDMLVRVGIFAALSWLLMQGGFWFGIRTLALAHGRLEYLYDTGQQLRSSLDLHDVLTQLAGDATTLGHAQYGFVALFDQTTSEIVLRATYDGCSGQVELHQRPIDEWFLRRCIATGMTEASPHSAAAYKIFFGADATIDKDTHLFCAPMKLGGRVVGAVGVLRSGAPLDPTEGHLVQELAAQAVTAIEQAQLFAKVRTDATAIEASYDNTLKALMAALDAKDNVTEGHCERVAKLTIHLAKLMDMPPAMLVHIERGALLHDVGKIGVPDAVLKKPAVLSDQEWEAMRKHPLLAGLMVSKVPFLEPALPILLYHHERFDGGGYPFGLAGDNIPLEARIFSIIDAYDAMTSDRPYRAAMAHRDAMAEVRGNAGKQFDPDVVASFEMLMATRPELREHSGRRVLTNHDDDLDPTASRDEPAA